MRRVRLPGSTLISIVRIVALVVLGVGVAYWRHEEPRRIQRDAVRQLLTDPDSAVFRNEHLSTSRPNTWCGEVDSSNLMGGLTGFVRYVVTIDEADPKTYTTLVESPDGASGSKFDSLWATYCEADATT